MWAHVDPAANGVPTQVAGWIRGNRGGVKRDIAVAVNGRIQATGRTFTLMGVPAEEFSIVVPESSLRPGRNRIRVLALARGRPRALTLLAQAP